MSDLHLGKRQFAASIEGRNAREVDIETAFRRAVDATVEAQPDLVTIAGDCFEHPRIGMHAVVAFRDGVRRLTEETGASVVVIQGNHDGGRTAEVLTPIAIARGERRVYVVTTPRRIRVRATSTDELVAVSCLPFTVLEEEATYRLDPDPEADVNVLLIHAPVNTSAEGAERLPAFYAGRESLDVGHLAEQFDVVAAGDYHEFHRLYPERLAFYSGSIERTSSNIWQERHEKGVAVYDTIAQQMVFRRVQTRDVYDRRLEDGLGAGHPDAEPTAENVNRTLGILLEAQQHRDAIVRLKVDDFPRSEKDRIDWELVRDLKQFALHFQLDMTYTADDVAAGDRRDHRGRSLLEAAREYFADDEEPVRELALVHLAGDA